MPQDNSAVEPPYWMAALHTLMYGRIYAYWAKGARSRFEPFTWNGNGRQPAHSRIWRGYQPQCDFRRTDLSDNKYIDGSYLSATFGQGSFWTKRPPMDEQRFNYSWRNWTYGERKDAAKNRKNPSGIPGTNSTPTTGVTPRAKVNGNGRARNFASVSRAGRGQHHFYAISARGERLDG